MQVINQNQYNASSNKHVIDYVICLHTENCTTEGELRLLSSSMKEGEGTVQICIKGAWGTICDDYWNTFGAAVVCRQLGYIDEGVFLAIMQN